MKIQLKRSSVLDSGVAKAPLADQMEFGELAINYNAGDPSIFVKDSAGNIVKSDLNFDSSAFVQVIGDNMTGNLTLGTSKITLDASNGNASFSGVVSTPDTGYFQANRSGGGTAYIGASSDELIVVNDGASKNVVLNKNGNASFSGQVTATGASTFNDTLTVGSNFKVQNGITTLQRDASGSNPILTLGSSTTIYGQITINGVASLNEVLVGDAGSWNKTSLASSGAASFASGSFQIDSSGNVTVGDAANANVSISKNGAIYANYKFGGASTDIIRIKSGTNLENTAFTVDQYGNASFAGGITSGGDQVLETGSLNVYQSSNSGSTPVFNGGWSSGGKNITSSIFSDGSASFGGTVSTDSYYTVDRDVTPGSGALYLGFTQGVQKFKVGTDGSASFSGRVDAYADGGTTGKTTPAFTTGNGAGASVRNAIFPDGSQAWGGDGTFAGGEASIDGPTGTVTANAFSGDGSALTGVTVDTSSLTPASTSTAGIVQLTDSVTSTSNTTAATPNSVKTTYDYVSAYAPSRTGSGASGTWGISISGNAATATSATTASSASSASDATNCSRSVTGSNGLSGGGVLNGNQVISGVNATTSAKGVVQLTDSASSTSTTTAGTANAVKAAYDRGSLGVTNAAAAQSTATNGVTFANAAQATADAALPKAGGTISGSLAVSSTLTVTNSITAGGYSFASLSQL